MYVVLYGRWFRLSFPRWLHFGSNVKINYIIPCITNFSHNCLIKTFVTVMSEMKWMSKILEWMLAKGQPCNFMASGLNLPQWTKLESLKSIEDLSEPWLLKQRIEENNWTLWRSRKVKEQKKLWKGKAATPWQMEYVYTFTFNRYSIPPTNACLL